MMRVRNAAIKLPEEAETAVEFSVSVLMIVTFRGGDQRLLAP